MSRPKHAFTVQPPCTQPATSHLQEVLWDGPLAVAAAFRDTSQGRFSITRGGSAVVRVQLEEDLLGSDCPIADRWFRAAREVLRGRGVDLQAFTIR